MEVVPTIFVSYEEMPGGEGLFVYLPDTAAALRAVETRNPRAVHVTRIRKVSTTDGQPNIDILCFSVEPITTERATEIGQNAMEWLMAERH